MLETWVLDHPDYGRIEVRSGFDKDFLAVDPDWPGEPPEKFKDDPDAGERAPADAKPWTRLGEFRKNPPLRLQILVDGEVQHQYDSIEQGSARIPLRGPGKKDKLELFVSIGTDRSKPHLRLQVNTFKDILQIEFREGSTVVEFDPPAGSRGERRREMMQSSPVRRTAIPIIEGIGKSGWAIAVIVLSPLIGRFLDWLSQFLPDWELPEFTLPHVDLPVPELPRVTLPTPNIDLPNLPSLPPLPEWVQLMMEYTKIWVPIVVGIAVGIIALRNYRKSEAEKEQWREKRASADTAETRPSSTREQPGQTEEDSAEETNPYRPKD